MYRFCQIYSVRHRIVTKRCKHSNFELKENWTKLIKDLYPPEGECFTPGEGGERVIKLELQSIY